MATEMSTARAAATRRNFTESFLSNMKAIPSANPNRPHALERRSLKSPQNLNKFVGATQRFWASSRQQADWVRHNRARFFEDWPFAAGFIREAEVVGWEIKGREFGNCNCDYGCPCQFNALPTHGHCRGLAVFDIEPFTARRGSTVCALPASSVRPAPSMKAKAKAGTLSTGVPRQSSAT